MLINRLIEALPLGSRDHLLPKLTSVVLTVPEMLAHTGDPIKSVYFPISGWVSTIVQMAEGRSAEVGLVGREGLIGVATGNSFSTVDQMVQGNGQALSMSRERFTHELDHNNPLRLLLGRYQASIYAQTAVVAACNGWHELEQRLARWLLSALDRADSPDLALTQDFLAMMLCVSRPRVTVIARGLQIAKIIDYNRGHIFVHDRDALEATACDCYQTMRDQMEHVFFTGN